jgi:hypothetical protein
LQNSFNFNCKSAVDEINLEMSKFSRLILAKFLSILQLALKMCAVDENFRDVNFEINSLQNFFSILQLLKCAVDEINFRDVKFSRFNSLQNFFSNWRLK